MIPASRKVVIFLILVLIGNALPLPLLWLQNLHLATTSQAVIDGQKIIDGLRGSPDSFASTSATFCFSMLGFLAAFLALSAAIGQTEAFRKYREGGYLQVLLALVAFTMIELVASFVISMCLFTVIISDFLVKATIYALATCLIMTVISIAPIIGMQLGSASER